MVKELLKNTSSASLLEDGQWSEHTMERELSGRFGVTYLQQFLNEQNLMEQPWIKDTPSST